jgi:hypothetical protein
MVGARARAALRALTGFAAAWAVLWPVSWLSRALVRHSARQCWGDGDTWSCDWSWGAYLKWHIGHALAVAGCGSYYRALLLATLLVPLAFAARMVVRARVRAGHVDPFERARRWMATRRRGTLAVAAIAPAALVGYEAMLFFGTELLRGFGRPFVAQGGLLVTVSDQLVIGAVWAIPAAIALASLTMLTRAGLRRLAAPVVDDDEPARADVVGNEIGFDAVAVTSETRAAVGGLAALTVAIASWLATASSATIYYSDARLVAAMAGYIALAVGGAWLFRRASRVSIGLDGVHVSGSSRTRFFAYRDLDAARAKGDDLVLMRGARTVLRLQLHGKDAARREAVLERIRAAIQRTHDERRDATTDFVSAASGDDLTRAAFGAGDYRVAALPREQLWALVEGPTVGAAARHAAAAALVKSGDGDARSRLRVTADSCADPRVRVALQKMCEGEDIEEPLDDASGAMSPAFVARDAMFRDS